MIHHDIDSGDPIVHRGYCETGVFHMHGVLRYMLSRDIAHIANPSFFSPCAKGCPSLAMACDRRKMTAPVIGFEDLLSGVVHPPSIAVVFGVNTSVNCHLCNEFVMKIYKF
jgi:hypothetical protein